MSTTPPAATSWPRVLLLLAAGVVSAFLIGKAPPALGAIRTDLGVGLVVAGWVISTFNVIGLALGTPAGALTSRLGDRRVVLGGLTLCALASGVGALAQGPTLLLATRVVEGLGFLLVVVGVPSLIMRLAAPADHKLAFGVWGTYMPAGTATMMTASPLLLAPFGWRGLWLGNAALIALFAVVLALATRGLPPPRQENPRRGTMTILADMWQTIVAGGPLMVALAFASYTLQYLAVVGFLPTILVEEEGLTQPQAAALTALVIAANVVGNLAGGALLHRGVPRWRLVATASAVMGLVSFGIYHPAAPLELRYALALVFSTVGGILPATVLGWAPATAPSERHAAVANGLVVQGSHLGQIIGPPALATLAVASGGWTWSPAILASAAIVGIALAWLLRQSERRRAGAKGTPVVGSAEMR